MKRPTARQSDDRGSVSTGRYTVDRFGMKFRYRRNPTAETIAIALVFLIVLVGSTVYFTRNADGPASPSDEGRLAAGPVRRNLNSSRHRFRRPRTRLGRGSGRHHHRHVRRWRDVAQPGIRIRANHPRRRLHRRPDRLGGWTPRADSPHHRRRANVGAAGPRGRARA